MRCTGFIYRSALPEQTRLFHSARSTKLLHVFAEVALAALGPHAGLTASATCPSPPRPPSQRLTARHPLCIQLRNIQYIRRSIVSSFRAHHMNNFKTHVLGKIRTVPYKKLPVSMFFVVTMFLCIYHQWQKQYFTTVSMVVWF